MADDRSHPSCHNGDFPKTLHVLFGRIALNQNGVASDIQLPSGESPSSSLAELNREKIRYVLNDDSRKSSSSTVLVGAGYGGLEKSDSSTVLVGAGYGGLEKSDSDVLSMPFISSFLPGNGYSGESSSAPGALHSSMVGSESFFGDIFPWLDQSERGQVVAVQPSDDGTSVAVLRHLPPKPMTVEEARIHAYGPPLDFILTHYSTAPGCESSIAPMQNSNFNDLGCMQESALPYGPFVNQYVGQRAEGIRAMSMGGMSLGDSSSYTHGCRVVENNNSNAGTLDGHLGKKDLNNFVLGLAKFEDGIRHLMGMLANGDPADTNVILEAVFSDVFAVMTDEYGLILFKNLLDFCNRTQKDFLLTAVIAYPVGVIFCSKTYYGARALIRLIDHVKESPLVQQLASILAKDIRTLLFDYWGGQVIKHCLTSLDSNLCEPLYEALIDCACPLALHRYGCSWVYTLIDNIKGVWRTRLLNVLADYSVQLANHHSGNYVVKHLLDLKDNRISMRICFLFSGYYKTLARDKHGSHVVEKCIQTPGICFVMDEFLNHSTSRELEQLACHLYGNYVIKQALKITEQYGKKYHQKLVAALLPGLDRLKADKYGKLVYIQLKHEISHKNGRGKQQCRS